MLPMMPMPDLARKGKALFHWDADVELPIKALREEILQLGIRLDVPVPILIGAIADVFALTAAKLDVDGGTRLLDDHLTAFMVRVEQTYRNKRWEMEQAARERKAKGS